MAFCTRVCSLATGVIKRIHKVLKKKKKVALVEKKIGLIGASHSHPGNIGGNCYCFLSCLKSANWYFFFVASNVVTTDFNYHFAHI